MKILFDSEIVEWREGGGEGRLGGILLLWILGRPSLHPLEFLGKLTT